MHAFDEAIALDRLDTDVFQGHIPGAYGNMVGPFGGIIAAVVLNAVLQHPQRIGNPVALTVNFAGPIADAVFQLKARPVRTNRSNQHWILELWQADTLAVSATALTARCQEPSIPESEWAMPAAPAAGQIPVLTSQLPLPWLEQYELRFNSWFEINVFYIELPPDLSGG